MSRKNIYSGSNSVAGIPTRGKVNSDWEVLENVYANSYDSLNSKLLTNQPNRFKSANPQSIAGRFYVLRLLCAKYCPSKLPIISKMESVSIAHAEGKINDRTFLDTIRSCARQAGLSTSSVDSIESRINIAEGKRPQNNPFQNRIRPNFLGEALRQFNPNRRR